MTQLTVATATRDGQVVVSAAGELDYATAPELRAKLEALVCEERPAHLILDLEGVSFCDSSGLQALIAGLKRVEDSDGLLVLACVPEGVHRLLHTTGLEHVFTIYPSVDEGLIGHLWSSASDHGPAVPSAHKSTTPHL